MNECVWIIGGMILTEGKMECAVREPVPAPDPSI